MHQIMLPQGYWGAPSELHPGPSAGPRQCSRWALWAGLGAPGDLFGHAGLPSWLLPSLFWHPLASATSG